HRARRPPDRLEPGPARIPGSMVRRAAAECGHRTRALRPSTRLIATHPPLCDRLLSEKLTGGRSFFLTRVTSREIIQTHSIHNPLNRAIARWAGHPSTCVHLVVELSTSRLVLSSELNDQPSLVVGSFPDREIQPGLGGTERW